MWTYLFCSIITVHSFSNFANRSCAWAFFTALLTSIYSIVDKYAAASGDTTAVLGKINYVYLQNAIAWLTISAVTRLQRFPMTPVRKRRAIPAGLIFLVSYSLIMLAFGTDPVAYVVSFRQLSIVITAVLSMLIIERQFSWPRLIGVLIIFGGILIIGFA